MLLLGLLGSVLVFLFAIFHGTSALKPMDFLFQASEKSTLILYNIRLPRAIASYVCGSAMALAGYVLQRCLNNRIASPSMLGIHSASGFMVLLAAVVFPFSDLAVQLASFAGAFLVCAVLLVLSSVKRMSKTSLLLSGVAISALFSAFINALLSVRPDLSSDRVAFTIGGFAWISMQKLKLPLIMMAISVVLLFVISRELDLFALGDEAAHGVGLNLKRARLLVITGCSMLTASSVSICGLIGFVGLIIPNAVRGLTLSNARLQMLLCMLYGGILLCLSDSLLQTVFYPMEIPAGVMISMIGAPCLLWILIHRKQRGDA